MHAQLRFGNVDMRHTFYVADLQYEAILGSNFLGKFGSTIDYNGGVIRLLPIGTRGPSSGHEGVQQT